MKPLSHAEIIQPALRTLFPALDLVVGVYKGHMLSCTVVRNGSKTVFTTPRSLDYSQDPPQYWLHRFHQSLQTLK